MNNTTPNSATTSEASPSQGASSQKGRFTTGSIWRHVIIMTAASAIGITLTFAIDLLAAIWVEQLDDAKMMAALGVAGAIMFFTISITIAMMIPTVALVSREYGRGAPETARNQASSSVIITLILQSLIIIALLPNLDFFIALIERSGDAEIRAYAHRFLFFVLPTMPFMGLGIIASAVLRAYGDAFGSMMITVLAAVTSAILDPLLILGLNLGLDGAAFAIMGSRFVMILGGYYFAVHKHQLFAPLREVNIRPTLKPFALIAAPSILTQLSTPFGNAIAISQLSNFGAEAMEAATISFRLLTFAFGGVFALSAAVGGIIGQNFGAGNMERTKETYNKSIIFGAAYALFMFALLMICQPLIFTYFSVSGIGVDVLKMFLYTTWSFAFTAMLFVSNAAFNNLNRPIWSTGFNWLRDGILLFPLILLLTPIFAAPAIPLAQAISNILSGIVAAFVGWRFLNSIAEGRVKL